MSSPDDHEIHLLGHVAHTGSGLARADVRVEIQRDADLRGRVDTALTRGRIVVGGHGGEDDTVGRARRVERFPGQGAGMARERREPHGVLLDAQPEGEPFVECVQDPPSRRRDLGSDVVAGEDYDTHVAGHYI
jgi:hypothetical protein